jgi:hypothetical protein
MLTYAVISRGGNNIPIGIDPNKKITMTVEGRRQLMTGEEPIVTIAIANTNNGELIKPVVNWYTIDFQLFRSKKYNSAISPSILSTSSFEENENAKTEFSIINFIIKDTWFLIHIKSSLTSNQGL